MAQIDWEKHQKQFAEQRASKGVTLAAYCKKNGLNANTARRYLKAQKIDEKTAQSSKKGKAAQTAQSAQKAKTAKASKTGGSSQTSKHAPAGKKSKSSAKRNDARVTDKNCASQEPEKKPRKSAPKPAKERRKKQVAAGKVPVTKNGVRTPFTKGNQAAQTHGGYAQLERKTLTLTIIELNYMN